MTTAAPLHSTPAHNLSSPPSETRSDSITVPATSSSIPRGPVTATLAFFDPPSDGSPPHNWVESPPEGQPQRNFGDQEREVKIQDIRGHESSFTLDNNAFEVLQNVPPSAEKDFTDDESIKTNYYPEVEQLVKDNVPGVHRVVIFDHTIRRSFAGSPRAPVNRVHIDQTTASAAARVRHHLPAEEAEQLLHGRYRIINVWRPLNGPVVSSPLGFADGSSVADEDLVGVEHRYPDRTGETAAVKSRDSQRWYYLSGMTNDERLLLKCSDSDPQHGPVGRVPHTAFADSRTPKDAPGRESIEVRTLVFG
ncbi:MAG: hypothetical protein M4579_000327 [Chaenotheca gracillima]|nr:MAG: hypothetical protein M4579_000327 [Chaenotheca gracillima]